MRKHLLVAGLAVATLFPTFAQAQATCQERRDNRVASTVVGATIGALLGNAIAKNDRTTGTIVGAVGGGVIGNQIGKANGDCARAYGYYDNNRVWHANTRGSVRATGYYDRNGNWVEGAPNGYYDANGRWIATGSQATAAGYYDAQRHWVPASSQGYYDKKGRWVSGTASGYYDRRHRWIPGPAMGYYNNDGRWVSGQRPGTRNEDGVWVTDPQAGHYDQNGRWVRGQVMGYYDARGRWIATSAQQQSSSGYNRPGWSGAREDTRAREAWFDQRIRQAINDRTISRSDGDYALRTLAAIKRDDEDMRRQDDGLSPDDQNQILARLDDLAREVNL